MRHQPANGPTIAPQSGIFNPQNTVSATTRLSEMRFERSQRGDEDPGGGFLAYPPPVPALLQSPFLEGLLPSHEHAICRIRRPTRGRRPQQSHPYLYRPFRAFDETVRAALLCWRDAALARMGI